MQNLVYSFEVFGKLRTYFVVCAYCSAVAVLMALLV